ncbi:MAG: hypothetical protein DME77_08940, partial [Verrucomicrobia bacterium]
MVPGSARNWIALNAVQQSSLSKQTKNSYENPFFNSIHCAVFHSPPYRRRGNCTRAICARRFRPERERGDSRRRRPTRRQDSYRRRVYHALAQRRSGGHPQLHCPAEPGRHARPCFRPERERCCLFNRGAGGRQDFSGRRFLRREQHRRTDAQPYRPARSHGQTRNHIARLDPTTGAADSFDPNANNDVFSIAVQADGKILAGGIFTTLSPNGGASVTRNHTARLETDGRLDQTLDLSIVGNDVYATAVQPDGKILIGGSFSSVLGVTRNNIARLNTDGTLDTAFDPNANSVVYSIAVQADGQILVGGPFSSIGGQTRNSIARLDGATGLADSFDPNANNEVRSIAVQADGKILAGGVFTSIGGQTRNRIARLDATTGLADSFDPNADSNVSSIAVQGNGKILAGGIFTSIGGQTRNRIARLDATTGLADSFDPNASDLVLSIAVQADGK